MLLLIFTSFVWFFLCQGVCSLQEWSAVKELKFFFKLVDTLVEDTIQIFKAARKCTTFEKLYAY